MSAIAGRELSMDFSAWVVSGLMLVAGATWLIVYNADILLGRGDARRRPHAGAGAGAEDGDGLPAARALPHRRHARDVHARRVHDRRRRHHVAERSCARWTTSTPSAAASTSAPRWRPRARSATPAPRARRELRRTSSSRRRERDGAAGQDGAGRAIAQATIRCAASTTASSTRRPTASPRAPRATTRRATSGTRWHAAPTWRWSTRSPRRGATTGASASPPDLRLHGFFIEDETFDPVRSSCATRGPADTQTLTVIGVLADTVPIEMAGLWTSHPRPPRLFGSRAVPTVHHLRSAPGVDPDVAARELERAFLANGMEAESVRSVLAGGHRRVLHAQLAAPRLHGPRPDRRRRRARRHQRPRGRRAPPADRRPALDRLPPRHGAAELPARVLVHRADRDRRRHRARPDRRLQRRRGRRRASRPGRARCTSPCRGRTSRSSSWLSSPPPC